MHDMGTAATEHLDVLIVGAGLSGIGAGCRLTETCPQKPYAILEARGAIGGTWDLFRYPGIRSDSDMYSLGYPFWPWTGDHAIGQGGEILQYIRDTATEYGVDRQVRYDHRVIAAAWSSTDARWTVTCRRADGEQHELTCGFLFWCSGYYSYESGYLPHFPGRERFAGPVIHSQQWDPAVDHAGKRVVVIGSGATAVTLVPALAEKAAHVTMLQRAPSYVLSYPRRDPLARPLLALLPNRVAHAILRWKNVGVTAGSWSFSRRWPKALAKVLIWQAKVQLPRGYDVGRHFTPAYDPWDQRLCLAPNGDLFSTLRQGRASVVTDRIASLTERGIRLESGTELEADIIVAATGLNVEMFQRAALSVDGRPVVLNEHVSYKGALIDGIPNMAVAFGYTNASFTLKCDLISRYVCRLLKHMDAHGQTACTPRTPADSVERVPLIDLSSGFVQRGLKEFVRQGSEDPWRLRQNYPSDIRVLVHDDLEDGVLQFVSRGSTAAVSTAAVPPAVAVKA